MTTLDDDDPGDAVPDAEDRDVEVDEFEADEAEIEGMDDPNATVETAVATGAEDGTGTDADADAEGEPADAAVPPVKTKKPSRRAHRAEMKASARRVRRVVRHIDTWSVFKVATIFVACIWGVVVLASLLVWRAAVTSGSVENTEDFIVDLGFEDFNFNPEQMFEALLSAGAVIAIAAVFFIWLLTVLFNLICDITGGLRITMIEQDLADARKRRARRVSPPAGQTDGIQGGPGSSG